MPRVWSWYQRVDARWSLGYWNTAEPGVHACPNFCWALILKLVPGPHLREAGVDVRGLGQEPGFRVAIALIAHTCRAVEVRDDRDRTRVRAGGAVEAGSAVPTGDPARRVRPVQGRIHGKEVREEVAVRVDQIVDPLD